MGEGGLTGTLLLRVMLFFLFSHPPRHLWWSAQKQVLDVLDWVNTPGDTRHALRTSGQCGTLNL